MKNFNIAIASDHAGYCMKEFVAGYLLAKGYAVNDLGTHCGDSVDYPVYAHALAREVAEGGCDLGVAICGSANGISMALNKHPKVRAAICWSAEMATLTRKHNDANICSLPARFISDEQATAILDAFFAAEFEGGRHQKRVDQIDL